MYTTPPGVHAKLMYWFQFGKNDSQYGALAQLLTSVRPLYRPQKFTIGSNVFVHKLPNTRLTLFRGIFSTEIVQTLMAQP